MELKCCDSQLPDNIFQPFKEQKWCPSLGAPNLRVNSECFAQKLRTWSKTPKFWSHEELWAYGDYKTWKNWHSLKFSYKLRGPTLEICNFFPIGHFGFLGGQLKWVTLYVLRAAFCHLAMFFSSSSFSLAYIYDQKNSHQ